VLGRQPCNWLWIVPLAHAQRREEVLVAGLHQLALRFLVLQLALVPLPEFEPGEELRFLVGEFLVRGVGRALLFLRPFARVLHGQRGGDDQHFLQAALVARGDDHARDARVERHLGQLLPTGVSARSSVTAPSSCKQLVAVADRLGRRRFDEREGLDVAEAQRLHAQDDAGQRRAQDFRVGKRRPLAEILLVVKADADAGRHPAAAPGALVGRGLRDLLDLQLLDLVAVRVALDARQPGIDHVADARHGQRGLGDVGRQHDAPPLMRLEDARLLLGREAGEERQDFGLRAAAMKVCLRKASAASRISRSPGRKTRMSPGRCGSARRRHRRSRRRGRARRPLGLFRLHRAVADVDRDTAARDLDHRRLVEMLREALGVDRRRGDDHLEIGPLRQQLLEVAEQEIDVQAALVRLVDDQRVVLAEPRIALRLGEQNAVGHQLDVGLRRSAVGEADLVADHRPSSLSSSCAMRAAVERAAMRRGCVWPIRPVVPRPSSRQIFGNCVVLPEPVSPQTITT
jgi:hypothetical protein